MPSGTSSVQLVRSEPSPACKLTATHVSVDMPPSVVCISACPGRSAVMVPFRSSIFIGGAPALAARR